MRLRYPGIINRKRLGLVALTVLAVVTLLSGCSQTGAIPRGWSGARIDGNALFVATMGGQLAGIDMTTRNRLWADVRFEAPKSTGLFGCSQSPTTIAIYGTPNTLNGLVYVAGYDGKVYAVNTQSGQLRWVYPRQDYIAPVVGSVVVGQGKLIFGASDGKVYALDAETGDLAWQFQTGDKIWATPAVDGDSVYVGSFDNKVYAFNIADGKPKWAPFETTGAITATPLISQGTLYIGSFDRQFYAINAADGRLKWRSPFVAGKWFWSNQVIYNGVVYAGNTDGKVYGFKADNGDKVAEYDLGSPLSSSLVLVDNMIVTATTGGQVYTIDAAAGQKRLLYDLKEAVYANLAVDAGVVFVHTEKDTIYGIDTRTGLPLWNLSLKS